MSDNATKQLMSGLSLHSDPDRTYVDDNVLAGTYSISENARIWHKLQRVDRLTRLQNSRQAQR